MSRLLSLLVLSDSLELCKVASTRLEDGMTFIIIGIIGILIQLLALRLQAIQLRQGRRRDPGLEVSEPSAGRLARGRGRTRKARTRGRGDS